jgi:hypothetical protein
VNALAERRISGRKTSHVYVHAARRPESVFPVRRISGKEDRAPTRMTIGDYFA